jgi:methyl-accepting chemotaxis protein
VEETSMGSTIVKKIAASSKEQSEATEKISMKIKNIEDIYKNANESVALIRQIADNLKR